MKLMLIFLCCMASLLALGQSAGRKSAPVFSCEKCHVASMKSGDCPGCHAKMVGINAKVKYVCADRHMSSMKPGDCAKCGKAMPKMAISYACDHCHVTSTKAGKCPKCSMVMKKHVMKIVG